MYSIREFNMRKAVQLVGSFLFSLCAFQAFGITLSPNAIGGGNIPGTYAVVDFYTSDGNWTPTLTLPASASPGATITIYANSGYSSNVVLTNTDLPLRSLTLVNGDRFKFTYEGTTSRWIAKLPDYSPNSTGATVPDNTNKLARYSFSDGNWVATMTLPAVAAPGAIMIVQSKATFGSTIAPTNVLHASTMRLATNERYAFIFHPDLKKWYILESPVAVVGLQQMDNGTVRSVTRPRTEVTLPAGTPASNIKLPLSAGDRDRIRVTSASTTTHTIRNDAIDFAGTLQLGKGDVYEFMWIAEKGRWTMMSSPSRSYDAQVLVSGRLPDMSVPTTRVKSQDGNWTQSVVLPSRAKPGDRVLVQSNAAWTFQVVPASAANFSSQPVTQGDTIAFVVNPDGRWAVETRTIAMLNVYADKVVAAFGSQAARARQLESFRLTNEALENSRANFRLKMVGLMQHRDQGTTLNNAVDRLRFDPVVQAERNRLKADAIYYEGAEEGCGLAWMNSFSLAYNMVATGSTNCGTTVMRHEFGHNMGLVHGGATGGSTVYAAGYTLLGTVMGGNAIPYYSTPLVYDATLGVPMGIAGKIDATRAMNERSEQVSNYYR